MNRFSTGEVPCAPRACWEALRGRGRGRGRGGITGSLSISTGKCASGWLLASDAGVSAAVAAAVAGAVVSWAAFAAAIVVAEGSRTAPGLAAGLAPCPSSAGCSAMLEDAMGEARQAVVDAIHHPLRNHRTRVFFRTEALGTKDGEAGMINICSRVQEPPTCLLYRTVPYRSVIRDSPLSLCVARCL